MSRRLFILFVLSLSVGLTILTGCEESVDPVLGTDQRFTVYGFINPLADTQAVRIYSIEDRLELETAEPLDASVYSEYPGGSERVVWQDSIVTFPDESVGHVYYGVFRPGFDRDLTFVVESPDGTLTRADVRTPPVSRPELGDIISASGNVLVTIDWIDAPRILETRAVYHLRSRLFGDSRIFDKTVVLPTGQVTEGPGGVLRVTIRPAVDIGQLFTILALRPGIDELSLEYVDVQAFVAGDTWDPPTGGFDPELLVQPGTFTNITNGFGFLGTGYYDSFEYVPSTEVAENAGFDVLDG
ncbi:MAG: hypothetical protein HKN17_03515 [Rhodothermales bacterium]|nr:hypothetical protein [Rhodothermales bacterium]